VVEVNSADSAGLTKIYGIGPAFASRIIKYRNRLGGFYSKEQLKEVYGLDAEKYAEVREQVRIDPAKVKKVNVNTAQF
jgi:competence protein ComEA